MEKIVGVQFQKNGKLYYFDANNIEAKVGDYVIVDTVRGMDLGEVLMGSREISAENWHAPLKKLIRIATEQDIQHGRDNRNKEKDAFVICQNKIAEHKLEMKLVSVEYAFDNSKIMFFFTANGRVDFRSLVKDLASVFKMRIELRQIGVRDEAKMLGGLGPCGRQICCGSFLDQFQPVSIKMAKEQNLSLNPTKISGVCGRLMCCLKFEQDHYEFTRKKMPKVGREVVTPDGTGTVTELNIVKETVIVKLTSSDSSEIKEFPLEKISKSSEKNTHSDSVSLNQIDNHNDSILPDYTDQTTENNNEQALQASDQPEISEKNNNTPNLQNSGTNNRVKQKNKKDKRSALGQPVRRENPNRVIPSSKEHESINDVNKPEPEHQSDGANSSTPWADALQKALQAIDQKK